MKQYQLPREFAQKWIAALRSGEYKQGAFKLMNGKNEFCCLGVASMVCEVDQELLLGKSLIIGFDKNNQATPAEGFENVPEILKGLANRRSLVEVLTNMNDSGRPFPIIADWIVENVEFV